MSPYLEVMWQGQVRMYRVFTLWVSSSWGLMCFQQNCYNCHWLMPTSTPSFFLMLLFLEALLLRKVCGVSYAYCEHLFLGVSGHSRHVIVAVFITSMELVKPKLQLLLFGFYWWEKVCYAILCNWWSDSCNEGYLELSNFSFTCTLFPW